MADDKESKDRLSATAAKAKRNLMFISAVAAALATGLISLGADKSGAVVSLGGLGVRTTIYAVWGTVGALLVYNGFEFWLHGPFGDNRSDERRIWIMNPWIGPRANADDLFRHITSVAGKDSLPQRVQSHQDLDRWMREPYPGPDRWTDPGNRPAAYRRLWLALPWRTSLLLRFRAPFTTPPTRRMVLEDLVEVWVTVFLGGIGAVSILFGVYGLLR